MKNAFDRLISRWNMAEKRTSELEEMSIKTTQIENQRGKSENIKNKISENCIRIMKVI